jgi:hypothetical protein
MKEAVFALACIALSACQGMQYAMDNYKGVPVTKHAVLPAGGQSRYIERNGKTVDRAEVFRIFDKPEEGRLMITPSLGASAGMGAVKGITLGGADGASEARMRQAAENYLAQSGRSCTTTSVDLVVQPQFEVRYTCQAPAASVTAAQ